MVYQKTRFKLKQEGLAPKKRLGQNFLVHKHTANRIVEMAGLHNEDQVIEVGVGLGALTRPLAEAVTRVIGLEADSGIIRMHEKQHDLPSNVELRHMDVLKADFSRLAQELNGPLKILANLPYSISTPFIFRLIEHFTIIDSAVVMLQKEVAMRLLAQPGTKEYGAPTVLLASCATTAPLLHIKPSEFHPKPKVDSMVVKITFSPRPERVELLGDFDRPLFRRIVNSAFGQRRKTLLNAVHAGGFLQNKEALAQCIKNASITPTIRAEKLTLEEYVALSHTIGAAITKESQHKTGP